VIDQFAIGPRVAVGNKGWVMRVRPEWRPGMLDGTEMLLRSSRDLHYVSQQSVGVRTIDASNFFDDVEIRQPAAVKHPVIAARNLGDSINRKADRLVDRDRQIQRKKMEWRTSR
jgi:hypothetical protein